MLDQLFNSKTRVRILALFFSNSAKKFYIQEIIRLTAADPANTHKELIKLRKLSILKSEKTANRKYYFLNKDFVYYSALRKLFTTYIQSEEQDKFVLLEEMPDYYPMIMANIWNVKRVNDFFRSAGFKSRFSKLLVTYNNRMASIWYLKNEFDGASKEIIDKLIKNPQWGKAYNQNVLQKSKQLFSESKKLLNINFTALSNKKLFEVYKKFYLLYESVHILHWIQTCVDLGDNLFSKYLMEYLRNRIENKKYSLGETFSILTTSTNEGNNVKEYKELLKILSYIWQSPQLKNYFRRTETRIIVKHLKNIDSKIDSNLNHHVRKYERLGYGTVGPGWNKDYFVDILSSLIRQNAKPGRLLKNVEDERRALLSKQKSLIASLKIDLLHRKLFKIARDIAFTKGVRKDSLFFSFSAIENLYKEVARRYYLSLNQVRYLYPHEIKDLLLKNRFSAAKLTERYKFSLYYSIGDYKDDILLQGKEAEKFLQSLHFIKEEIKNVKLLQGDCASSGMGRGEVAIINVVEDMEKMKDGGVLVSTATNPDLVPAIKKASAIVTDVGGITCHAAIISRELGIPCVIGTRIATKVLCDGDLVDVYATHGKVTIIKRAKKI